MQGKIIVIGSTNTDMVIKTNKFPAPGETVIGGQFFMFPGGKGANQAVAAARLGGAVTFIAKIGNDIFGKQAISQFEKEGIHTQYVVTDAEHPSGVALITVDGGGENSIVVASGANGTLSKAEIDRAAHEIHQADVVLFQLETPIQTVVYGISRSYQMGRKVILNPAPAQVLPEEIYPCLFLLTPNETEAEMLTGIQVKDTDSARQAAQVLRQKGVQNVVLTLGARGAYVQTETISQLIAAPPVKAIDTTAAGDVFNGALAVAISENMDLATAVTFACRAAAISVTVMGAQASAPYRREIASSLASQTLSP